MLKAFELECEGFADYLINEICGKISFWNNASVKETGFIKSNIDEGASSKILQLCL